MLTIGLIVNPFAGIGGATGLKGSDGAQTVAEALRRGAQPQAPARAARALELLVDAQVRVLTWGGAMGEDSAREAGLPVQVIGTAQQACSADDTRSAATALLDAGVDLLVFAGGDGTARDICDVVALRLPVLGIPAGCKMHSAVYAVNPEAAGRLLLQMAEGGLVNAAEAEVRDIDEQAFRQGVVRARHYGVMLVPQDGRFLQQVKCGGQENEALAQVELAAWLVEQMADDVFWLIGSGSTMAEVMAQLGLPNTLLGVDIIRDGQLVAADVSAGQILEVIGDAPAKAMMTVIGGQGHLIGRGNQQFSPAVIRRLGMGNIVVAATRSKLADLAGRPLLVDSGDAQLDQQLCGLIPVAAGYDDVLLVRVATDASLES
ncbi:MAG: ATP-NAD kinase family protein [Alcanivoracaceae bacterium]|nr:ATP-NAD kinase family protein [Alcanivoracaceae bacterium]